MNERLMRISEEVFVGPQPSEEGLRELASEKFASVINLRTANEENQPLSPREEGIRVQELGMDYLSLPVSKEEMSAHQVDDFRSKLELVEKPVLVHCGSGKRAGAFVMMDQAARQGWSGEETLQKAAEMGFECDVPELKQFLKRYVDEKQGEQQ